MNDAQICPNFADYRSDYTQEKSNKVTPDAELSREGSSLAMFPAQNVTGDR